MGEKVCETMARFVHLDQFGAAVRALLANAPRDCLERRKFVETFHGATVEGRETAAPC